MTLLWADGFRRGLNMYEDSTWVEIGPTFGRDNGLDSYGCRAAVGAGQLIKAVPARSTLISGVAGKPTGTGARENMSFLSGSQKHLYLCTNTNASGQVFVELYHGNGTILGTSGILSPDINEFLYLEMKALIADAGGWVEVRNYGTTIINVAGIDTRNAGNAEVDRVRLNTASGCWYDDFYICDTLGTVNNDFLATPTANPRIIDLFPNGPGDASDWVPIGAATDWEALDEQNPDGDTSYIYSNSVGDKALVNLSALPAGAGAVLGVVQWVQYRKDDATARNVTMLAKSGGVEQDVMEVICATSYQVDEKAVELDPATGVAFTPAAINALQIGVEVTA